MIHDPSGAFRALLCWHYGPERAADIMRGDDIATATDIRRWNRFGAPPRWTEAQREELRRLWPDRALSQRIIGILLGGKTASQVGHQATRLGLPPRPAVSSSAGIKIVGPDPSASGPPSAAMRRLADFDPVIRRALGMRVLVQSIHSSLNVPGDGCGQFSDESGERA